MGQQFRRRPVDVPGQRLPLDGSELDHVLEYRLGQGRRHVLQTAQRSASMIVHVLQDGGF